MRRHRPTLLTRTEADYAAADCAAAARRVLDIDCSTE
jgi:hypothetical protein